MQGLLQGAGAELSRRKGFCWSQGSSLQDPRLAVYHIPSTPLWQLRISIALVLHAPPFRTPDNPPQETAHTGQSQCEWKWWGEKKINPFLSSAANPEDLKSTAHSPVCWCATFHSLPQPNSADTWQMGTVSFLTRTHIWGHHWQLSYSFSGTETPQPVAEILKRKKPKTKLHK